MKLMVYGTLQQGYWNNRLLEGAKFLGPSLTKTPYVLFNCGFPKAVPFSLNEEKCPLLPVMGELYEVDEAHVLRCDRLEGHPDWYIRKKIAVTLDGNDEEAYIYEMPEWQQGSSLCSIVREFTDTVDNMYYRWVG